MDERSARTPIQPWEHPRVTEPHRQRLWTWPFVTLSVSRTAVGFTFYLLVPTIAAYAMRAYDVTEEEAGWASSSFFFGALISRALSGWALQRHGSRAVVLTSLVGLLLASLGYLLPVGFSGLLVLRTLHGIAFGFAATALTSAAMILAPATRRAEASGWFLVGVNLATGLAPFIALAITASVFGPAGVFWLTAIFSVVALLVALPVARSIPGRPKETVATGRGIRGLIDPRALPIAGVAGLCTLAYGAILTYLNLLATERGLLGAAGFYFLVYAGVTLVSRPLSGILQDRGNDDVVRIPLLVDLLGDHRSRQRYRPPALRHPRPPTGIAEHVSYRCRLPPCRAAALRVGRPPDTHRRRVRPRPDPVAGSHRGAPVCADRCAGARMEP